jgi:hypothetical protein
MHVMTMYCCYYSCNLIFMWGSCLLFVKKSIINQISNAYCKYTLNMQGPPSCLAHIFLHYFWCKKNCLYKFNKQQQQQQQLDPHTKIFPTIGQKNLLMYVGFKDYNNLKITMNLSTNGQLDVKISSSNMELTLSMDFIYFFIHYWIFICIIHWNCEWNYNHIFSSH